MAQGPNVGLAPAFPKRGLGYFALNVFPPSQPEIQLLGTKPIDPHVPEHARSRLFARCTFAKRGWIVVPAISILASLYETVSRRKARNETEFDMVSVMVMNNVVVIVFGVVLASIRGQMPELINRETPRKLFLYCIPSLLFEITTFVQYGVGIHISSDVSKVLSQTNILVIAVLEKLVWDRTRSVMSWLLLLVITFGSITYGLMSDHEDARIQLTDAMENGEEHNMDDHVQSFRTGVALSVLLVFTKTIGSVWSEYFLKKDDHVPFYVQKVYIAVPGLIVSLAIGSPFVSEWAKRVQLKEETAPCMFTDGIFKGWDASLWLVIYFVLFIFKSWASGILVKTMSALVQQMCGITSVGMLYFAKLIHLQCPEGSNLCLGNLGDASEHMVFADVTVISSVLAYAIHQNHELEVFRRERLDKAKMIEIVQANSQNIKEPLMKAGESFEFEMHSFASKANR